MVTSTSAQPDWATSLQTVLGLFGAAVTAAPQRVYCRSETVSLSYAEAAGAVRAVAEELGPQARGRAVALVLSNSPAFLVAYFGALAAGAQPALVNYGHPDATVLKLLGGLDLAAVFSDRQIAGLDIRHFDDAVVAGLAKADAGAGFGAIGAARDVAGILFSGGTTGLPKQVPHSNLALVRKVERMEWGWPTRDGEVWLPVAPFTHVYGYLMGVLNPLLRAGTIVIPPRFHPDLIVQMLRDEKVTVFGGGPPAIYQALMASEVFGETRFAHLHTCPGGGAPFPLDVHRRWQAATGLAITEGYGMTEIAPICVNTERDGVRPGSAGHAVPDTVIEIVDIQTGRSVLPVGQSGEIRVRGPHMMTGYTGNDAETAQALREGFVYTGDIGSLDTDGYLTISDRKKDVIFVKGFNVFPREVEEVLLSHPAVSGACVVGREDARAGERPVAFVSLRDDVDAGDVAAFCAEHLADYKLPVTVEIMEALPLTPAGKLDRTALRAMAGEAGR